LESQTNLQKTRQREREKKEMRNEDNHFLDGFVGGFAFV